MLDPELLPTYNKSYSLRLSPEDRAFVLRFGDGSFTAGVVRMVRICAKMATDAAEQRAIKEHAEQWLP